MATYLNILVLFWSPESSKARCSANRHQCSVMCYMPGQCWLQLASRKSKSNWFVLRKGHRITHSLVGTCSFYVSNDRPFQLSSGEVEGHMETRRADCHVLMMCPSICSAKRLNPRCAVRASSLSIKSITGLLCSVCK